MSAHYGPQSHEGLYPSSSPPSESHDAFVHNQDHRYYDDEDAAHLPRRNTVGSESSETAPERYYDHNGPYDPYGRPYLDRCEL
jgi:1,3-beta-glucan synthase